MKEVMDAMKLNKLFFGSTLLLSCFQLRIDSACVVEATRHAVRHKVKVAFLCRWEGYGGLPVIVGIVVS